MYFKFSLELFHLFLLTIITFVATKRSINLVVMNWRGRCYEVLISGMDIWQNVLEQQGWKLTINKSVLAGLEKKIILIIAVWICRTFHHEDKHRSWSEDLHDKSLNFLSLTWCILFQFALTHSKTRLINNKFRVMHRRIDLLSHLSSTWHTKVVPSQE